MAAYPGDLLGAVSPERARFVDGMGKLLMVAGALLFVAGALVQLAGRLPGGFLPGDIVIEKKNFGFYFPVVTCLVVSIVLTVLLNLFGRR